MNPKEAFIKACRFCAYQERTQQEVRTRLYELEMWPDAVEEIISKLITENFINEERFAKAYASGKFRQNKWGRIKIRQGLKAHGLTEYCIKKGLAEIDGEAYEKTLRKLLDTKRSQSKEKNPLKKRQKILTFLIGKGYESDIVIQMLNENVTDQ